MIPFWLFFRPRRPRRALGVYERSTPHRWAQERLASWLDVRLALRPDLALLLDRNRRWQKARSWRALHRYFRRLGRFRDAREWNFNRNIADEARRVFQDIPDAELVREVVQAIETWLVANAAAAAASGPASARRPGTPSPAAPSSAAPRGTRGINAQPSA